jgi:uncharacterized protein (DUF58 family)
MEESLEVRRPHRMIGALLDKNPRIANWLYGFTPPERGAVVLGHRRVYIVPTRLGWLFAATLAVLLVGAINYALSLGFALTFMLAGMALAGMVHTARNLARIAVSAGRCEPVFVGEPAQFRIHLDSRVNFDRPAILTRHLGSGSQLVVDIPAGGLTDVVLAVPARGRGWLPLGRLMLETRFPLGLFRAWSYVEPEANCLVYPRPERSNLPLPTADAAAGSLQTQSTGNEDFAGLRGYQPADSPRHVAWKAVARSDDMLTKQFSGEAAAELWLDWQLLPASLAQEQRLSRLAGWVLAAPGLDLHPRHAQAVMRAVPPA